MKKLTSLQLATAAKRASSETLRSLRDKQADQFHNCLNRIWEAAASGSSGQLTIGGQEMFLLANVYPSPMTNCSSLDFAGGDLLEELVRLGSPTYLGIDGVALAAKLHLAPFGTLVELFTDLNEAWKFYKNEQFFCFLQSRHYRFRPLSAGDLLLRGSCVFGAELADGSLVVDRAPSHVREENIDAVTRALRSVDPAGRTFIEQELKFGGVVGKTTCLRTDKSDEVVMAQRLGRHGPTRFVKGREPEACDTVFVVLKKVRQHRYLLVTAFVGQRPEPEPWDERSFSFSKDPGAARERSKQFWANHALTYAPELIVPGTEQPEV